MRSLMPAAPNVDFAAVARGGRQRGRRRPVAANGRYAAVEQSHESRDGGRQCGRGSIITVWAAKRRRRTWRPRRIIAGTSHGAGKTKYMSYYDIPSNSWTKVGELTTAVNTSFCDIDFKYKMNHHPLSGYR
jgi:hypothetical protein